MNGQFKANKLYFRVNEKKGIYNSTGEKLATILGDLHLILFIIGCTTLMLNFSPLEQKLVSLFMKQSKKINGQKTVPMMGCFNLLIITSILIQIT